MVALRQIADRGRSNAYVSAFRGDKLAVLFPDLVGIGVADAQGNHGLAGGTDVDGDGRDSAFLAQAGFQGVGKEVPRMVQKSTSGMENDLGRQMLAVTWTECSLEV